jgi:ketosteroid isomerase-like protein
MYASTIIPARMTQQNVDALRNALHAFNERGLDPAAAEVEHLLHPDFGIQEAEEVPDRETYSGRDAFIANLRKVEEAFEEIRLDPVEFVDLEDHIVVVVVMSGRGRGSGAPVEMRFAQLWSIEAGKATSLRDFATKEEAIKAAGAT